MRTTALACLALGALLAALAGVASALSPEPDSGAPFLLAGAVGLLLAGLFLAGSGSRPGRIATALGSGVWIGGTLMALVVLHGRGAGRAGAAAGELILGLPPGAALTVYGLGLLPVVIVPLVFTLAETAAGLDPEALDALRRRAASAAEYADTPGAQG